jgi:hypothetical protein
MSSNVEMGIINLDQFRLRWQAPLGPSGPTVAACRLARVEADLERLLEELEAEVNRLRTGCDSAPTAQIW